MLATAAQTTTENMGLGGPPGKARGGPREGWFPDQGRVVPRPGYLEWLSRLISLRGRARPLQLPGVVQAPAPIRQGVRLEQIPQA